MSLIPEVGRKTWSMRTVIGLLYLVLSLGALTMIYPFLVMLSTSIRSGADLNDYTIIPKYLHDDGMLFSKYAEIKYAANMTKINNLYGTDFVKSEDIAAPQKTPLTPGQTKLVQDWREFRNTLAPKYTLPGFGPIPLLTAPSRLLDIYRSWLTIKFDGDISKLNRQYREENVGFQQVSAPLERPTNREWAADKTSKMTDWLAFKKTLSQDDLNVVACDPLFSNFLKQSKYDGDIKKLNAAYGTTYKSFNDLHLSRVLPTDSGQREDFTVVMHANPGHETAKPLNEFHVSRILPASKSQQADWEDFVRTVLPFRYMGLSSKALPVYRQYLSARYGGNVSKFNETYKTTYASFKEISLPAELPSAGIPLSDWKEFIAKAVPIDDISAETAENSFRQYVQAKYKNIYAINKAYRTRAMRIEDLSPPFSLSDWSYVQEHRTDLQKHFITRNYAMVLGYILFHGRAVLNTFIFCLAVILTHLIVNPLCAYALSRYNLRYAYRVLLFLLATMAFPAEVAMIPNFLLLKQLNLLNTYWALVLPGMASGFSIFLLKGFFDSLPKELYEAGILDGASEPIMFWKITMPLSKPIFAVIALQSFVAAYGAFMFAFLVCQNPKMWTMMVWLYELQITAPKYITMSALTIAAIPTLLVFVFAQNVIMRGIILPSFK